MNSQLACSVLADEKRFEVALLRQNGEAEFTAMVERHGRFVFRIAYSLLRNAHDAEDAVQDMLLNLYRRSAWLGLRDERAFLARAVWRTALDKLRRGQAEAREVSIEESEFVSHTPDPERDLVGSDWTRHVQRLVDHLPEELRRPLVLSAIDDMSSREIAAIMRIPEGTVRSRLGRARQILRAKLAAQERTGHART